MFVQNNTLKTNSTKKNTLKNETKTVSFTSLLENKNETRIAPDFFFWKKELLPNLNLRFNFS